MDPDQEYRGNYIRIKPESKRAENFLQVFGRLERIPVVFGEPDNVYDEAGQARPAYLLSLARLTSGEMNNLAVYYADKLRILPDEARTMLKSTIIPIYADDCEVEA